MRPAPQPPTPDEVPVSHCSSPGSRRNLAALSFLAVVATMATDRKKCVLWVSYYAGMCKR